MTVGLQNRNTKGTNHKAYSNAKNYKLSYIFVINVYKTHISYRLFYNLN